MGDSRASALKTSGLDGVATRSLSRSILSGRTAAQASQHRYDAAVCNSDDDLLGFNEYAKGLAEILSTPPIPLTVGIYGQWGEGKTSFACLLRHHLQSVAHEQPLNGSTSRLGSTRLLKLSGATCSH